MADKENPAQEPLDLQKFMTMMVQANQTSIVTAVTEAVRAMREPTPEEAEAKSKEIERIRRQRLNAAEIGKQTEAQLKADQANCQHLKPNNDHTFRGAVHSDGWATIRCIRCLKEWRVKPMPEHISQGLNLGDIKNVTVQILDNWAKNSEMIARKLEMQEAQARRHQQQINREVTAV